MLEKFCFITNITSFGGIFWFVAGSIHVLSSVPFHVPCKSGSGTNHFLKIDNLHAQFVNIRASKT